MIRALFLLVLLSFFSGPAQAADACQNYVKLEHLPASFKLVSKSALGSAELHIASDGTCTCNDLPAVQRGLGNEAPAGVNWACDDAEAADTKSK